jgi:hypothetical protein
MVLAVILWAAGMSEAQDGLTKRNSQGPVTVSVTLMNLPAPGDPVKAKVVLDTHSVALDSIKFEEAVAFRTGDGSDIPPSAVEQATGSGHHREAVLIFARPVGTGALTIIIKNVGGVAERIFSWELPASR